LKTIKGKKLGYDGKYLYVFLSKTSPIDPARIMALYRKKPNELRFTPDYKLFVPAGNLCEKEIITQTETLLKMLAQ